MAFNRVVLASSLLLIFGAVFGTLGDAFHVLSQTDGYTPTSLAIPATGQPFWVPLLFGSATFLIGMTHSLADAVIGPKNRPARTWRNCILSNSSFLLLYAASGFLPLSTGGMKDWVLAMGAFGVWAIFGKTWQSILLGIGTAAVGTIFEMYLVHQGAFFYYPSVANLNGVPSWLPWLYVAASVSVGDMGRLFMQRTQVLRPMRRQLVCL
jgi:hypothetical protein